MNALLAPLTLAQKRTLIMPSKKCEMFVTHIAIRFGNIDMFEILWDLLTPEEKQYLFKAQEPFTGNRLLHLMVSCKSDEALLKNCLQVMPSEDIPALLMMQDYMKNTILHEAALYNPALLEYFLQKLFQQRVGCLFRIVLTPNKDNQLPFELCEEKSTAKMILEKVTQTCLHHVGAYQVERKMFSYKWAPYDNNVCVVRNEIFKFFE